MTTPFQIADRLTEEWADLSPVKATQRGIAGRDHLCTDHSPDGEAKRVDLYQTRRQEMAVHLDHPDPDQARAAMVTVGWLDGQIARYESGKWKRDINHIYSPFQQMRDSFDVMSRETAADWDNICARLFGFSSMLEGYQEALTLGMEEGDTAALRQAESLLSQVELAASDQSRFLGYPEAAVKAGVDPGPVTEAVVKARTACSDFARWLRSSYLPLATPDDAVGEERYLEGADEFLGMDLEPHETYQWGWAEVYRLRQAMAETAAEIDPDKTLAEVIDLLQTDPARSAATREEFVKFISDLQAEAVSKLAGTHFEVPTQLKTVTVNMAPPGGSLGAWYNAPTEDFSRPGSIWYSPGERERLPYWQEVSTAYHEGFPGHHLQVGTAVLERMRLSRFQRTVVWYSGSGEGWALYAERLMDELGFFEKPEYRLGLLASQLFRATRVVVDIGCQLKKRIPLEAPLYPGEVWDYHRAVDYMEKIGLQARDVADSEVTRYLGWWGQAISYKVGEREILDIRSGAMQREGNGFNRKDFHRRMLEAGAIRLDHLRQLLCPPAAGWGKVPAGERERAGR